MDRATVEAVLCNAAWYCSKLLKKGDGEVSAAAVQRLLPEATPQLPLPPGL